MVNASTDPHLVAGRDKRAHQEWSPLLEVGVPSIDEQHKRFFELAASVRGDRDHARVMRLLSRLNDYVREHFRDEEALMAMYDFPGIEGHTHLHQQFRSKVADMVETAGDMTLDEISEQVGRLINGWLSHHIMTVDVEYLPYVRKSEAIAAEEDPAR